MEWTRCSRPVRTYGFSLAVKAVELISLRPRLLAYRIYLYSRRLNTASDTSHRHPTASSLLYSANPVLRMATRLRLLVPRSAEWIYGRIDGTLGIYRSSLCPYMGGRRWRK